MLSAGADPGFSEGGGGGGQVASTACAIVEHSTTIDVHRDLSRPPQVMHKAWKLLSCRMKAFVVSSITITARKKLSLISALLMLNDVRFSNLIP
jgi:hypothetical protein